MPRMTDEPLLGPEWADLVFHVLAHVPGTRQFASSLDDAPYRAFCEQHLGPAAARSLGEDTRLLSQLLTSHELLARVQWLAFLFDDVAAARRSAARDLAELRDRDAGVSTPARRSLCSEGFAGSPLESAAELLRAAAELEAPHHSRLPAATLDPAALSAAVSRAAAAAPCLKSLRIRCLRSLARRGRVAAPDLYVGVPDELLGVTHAGTAVQAAHEATVVEVAEAAAERGAALGERAVEQVAVVLLAERARRSPIAEDHERWWRAMALPAADLLRDTLPGEARRLCDALAQRSP